MSKFETSLPRWIALAAIAALPFVALPASAQSSSKPSSLDLPEIAPSPVDGSASSLALRKRLLTPRTGTAVPTGISGQTNTGGYAGGNSNGINTGADATRSSNGGAGTIAAPIGSQPLPKIDRATANRRLPKN